VDTKIRQIARKLAHTEDEKKRTLKKHLSEFELKKLHRDIMQIL
jgi:hypothetical protein